LFFERTVPTRNIAATMQFIGRLNAKQWRGWPAESLRVIVVEGKPASETTWREIWRIVPADTTRCLTVANDLPDVQLNAVDVYGSCVFPDNLTFLDQCNFCRGEGVVHAGAEFTDELFCDQCEGTGKATNEERQKSEHNAT